MTNPTKRSEEVNKIAMDIYNDLIQRKVPMDKEGEESNLTFGEALDIAATLIPLFTTQMSNDRDFHINTMFKITQATLNAFDTCKELEKVKKQTEGNGAVLNT